MKINKYIIFLGMFILIFSSFVSAEILIDNTVTNNEFNLNITQSITYTGSDYAEINKVQVIAYNPLFRDSLYLRLKDDFNANQTLFYGSKIVEKTPKTITFDFSDVTIEEGRTYYLEFTGNSLIKLYGENSTIDTYTEGKVLEYNNTDLFFTVQGEEININYGVENATYTNTKFSNNDEARYYYNYFNTTTDILLDKLYFKLGGYNGGNANTALYSIRSYLNCGGSNYYDLNTYENHSYFTYSGSGSGYSGEPTFWDGYIDVSTLSITLNGGESCVYVYGERTTNGGAQLERVSYPHYFNISNQTNFFYGSAVQSYLLNNNLGTVGAINYDYVFHSIITFQDLGTCSGTNCEGYVSTINETFENITEGTAINDNEVNSLFNDFSSSEDRGKPTARGLFITLLLIIFICSSAWYLTNSFFVVLSISFKLMVLSIYMNWLPFYIPLALIMLMIGIKLFIKGFNLGENNGY